MTELLNLKYFYIIFFFFITLLILSSNKISADQKIKIIADEIKVKENNNKIEASGNAVAQDEKGAKINSDFLSYDKNQSLINAEGNIILNDIDGNTYFFDEHVAEENIRNLKALELELD